MIDAVFFDFVQTIVHWNDDMCVRSTMVFMLNMDVFNWNMLHNFSQIGDL